MKLSLCLITYNEEKNIHYPLDSAYDLADEVIVIDGGSTDKTVEIAKSYGRKVKVFIVDNPPNFLLNKQRAIEKASGEWILQLDSDEALSDELKKEIKDLIRRNFQINSKSPFLNKETGVTKRRVPVSAQEFFQPVAGSEHLQEGISEQDPSQNIVAFNIPRKNFFLTRFLMKGGVYPDYVLRLYKRQGAYFDLKDLHENVKISPPITSEVEERSGKTSEVKYVGYLKNTILHYADPDFSRYLLRWDRYTSFDAKKLHQKVKSQKSKVKSLLIFFDYFFVKPTIWFLKTYFRHKGFMDGFPGFVFSLFSSIRFWVIYIKFYTKRHHHNKTQS